MLDTVVQQNSREMVLQVLRFGTQKLFQEDKSDKPAADIETEEKKVEETENGKPLEKRKEVYEIDKVGIE